MTAATIGMLLAMRPSTEAFLMGLPFVVVGEAIRIWSSGYINKMRDLTTGGPFAMCRNPLYVGSFFICAGYCVMSNQPVVWFVVVPLFWLFHAGAVAVEEDMLRLKFGQSYVDYCGAVPRFLPRPWPLRSDCTFVLRQVMANKEHRTILATALVVGLFAIRAFSGF